MSEENDNTVEETENRYESLLKNPLYTEFQELKDEYKAARKRCASSYERTIVMETYASDLMDIACEAQMLKDWNLLVQINTIIDSINRRTAKRSYRSY